MNREKTKGFTLIELLVVIAIIAILAIAIVVAYNRAKDQAKNSQRVSICREIATAQEMYYTENDRYCSSLDDLLDGYLASDPDESKIGPNSESSTATWRGVSYFRGDNDGFRALARLRLDSEDDSLFCCNVSGCRNVETVSECSY